MLDSLGEFDHRLDGFANLGVRLARSGILDEAIESLFRLGDGGLVVDVLDPQDRATVVDFDGASRVLAELTSDKAALHDAIDLIDSAGGTDIGAGMRTALSELAGSPADRVHAIVLLTDGEGAYDHTLSGEARAAGIPVFAVGLSDEADQDLLGQIARATLGAHYEVANADDLVSVFQQVVGNIFNLGPDRDSDGLTDCEEILGIEDQRGMLGAGSPPYYTDPDDPDTDNDRLQDGEEVGPLVYETELRFTDSGHPGWFGVGFEFREVFGRHAYSDPTRKHSDRDRLDDFEERSFETDAWLSDSDFDGLDDDEERRFETDPNARETDDGDPGDDVEVFDDFEIAIGYLGYSAYYRDVRHSSIDDWLSDFSVGSSQLEYSIKYPEAGLGADESGAYLNGLIARMGADPRHALPVDLEALELVSSEWAAMYDAMQWNMYLRLLTEWDFESTHRTTSRCSVSAR